MKSTKLSYIRCGTSTNLVFSKSHTYSNCIKSHDEISQNVHFCMRKCKTERKKKYFFLVASLIEIGTEQQNVSWNRISQNYEIFLWIAGAKKEKKSIKKIDTIAVCRKRRKISFFFSFPSISFFYFSYKYRTGKGINFC